MSHNDESLGQMHDGQEIKIKFIPCKIELGENGQLFTKLGPIYNTKTAEGSIFEGIYFTKFPGIDLPKCQQVMRKTLRELRKNAKNVVPDTLVRFFNAQQRRKRFNLAPGTNVVIDIYEQVTLQVIAHFNTATASKITTAHLVEFFNSKYIAHFYDPNPMPKDFIHKNGDLQSFLHLDHIPITPNMSRSQGYHILEKIRQGEIQLEQHQANQNHCVNVLNWSQTFPQLIQNSLGMRGTTLHLSFAFYKIKIGTHDPCEGYLISFNDKGPRVILDGKNVESTNHKIQLVLTEDLSDSEKTHYSPAKSKKPKKSIKRIPSPQSRKAEIVLGLSLIHVDKEIPPYFQSKTKLHPKDENFNPRKTNRYHSEFKILNNLVEHLGLGNYSDPADITGELFLFSEKTPCYGCLDVIWNQFNAHFPNITLKYNFAYGIRAADHGFHTMQLDRENFPIMVPDTIEYREKGFQIHSAFLLTPIRTYDEIMSYLSSFQQFASIKPFLAKYCDFAETFKNFHFPF